MALVKSRAIVLRTYKLGETSKVVVCYTRNYGKVRLVAKGGRTGGSRFGAALEPMTVSGVLFYLKEGRDLHLVSQAETERGLPELRRDVERMAFAGAVLEITDRLVADREPDPGLFDLVEFALGELASVEPERLDASLWKFEFSLASALGYRPELERCTVCGGPPGPSPGFSAELGGLVCGRCGADGRGEGAATGRAAELLRTAAGGGAVRVTGENPSVRDEVGDVALRYLEAHTGTRLRLRSLEFLAQVRRAQEAGGETESGDRERDPGSERR